MEKRMTKMIQGNINLFRIFWSLSFIITNQLTDLILSFTFYICYLLDTFYTKMFSAYVRKIIYTNMKKLSNKTQFPIFDSS